MDKEKTPRKKISDLRDNLAAPAQQHQQKSAGGGGGGGSQPILPEAFRRLFDYKDREAAFLKNINETIAMDCKKIKSESERPVPNPTSGGGCDTCENVKTLEKSDCELLKEECDNYIMPLLNRTGPSISAALVTYDAFEQLNRLHGLLDQMLTIQEQNYQMRRYLRDVRTLCELKKLQKKDPVELLNEGEISDGELDLENQVSLLSTILAAGNSASTKRSCAKRQRERSKSVIAEDVHSLSEKDAKPVPMRRQSAFTESKGKVSKWTKVKAAFKWERANVPALIEGKSSDSGIGLTPINNEVARYLRVPSVPCTASSADSVLSSSSGHLLSGGSIPPTPGTISSASSIEDVGAPDEIQRIHRDSSKSDSRCDSRAIDEQSRRSRSLDGDAIIGPTGQQSKTRTPWKKVKDIIQTHRGSFKNKARSRSIKSSESIGSRDASPCGSIDTISNIEDRNEGHMTPNQKNISSSPQDQESGSLPSSPSGPMPDLGADENDQKTPKLPAKNSRKSRMLSDFESLPEDVPVDLKAHYRFNRQPPSPLNLSTRQDSSDAEFQDLSYSPTVFLKSPNRYFKMKKPLTPGNSSVPSSPSRHSEFFGEFESEDFSSGDFSEPTTPLRKLSPKSSMQQQQDEVNEKYFELREKLKEEFETKRQEWEKIRSACAASTTCAYQLLTKEDVLPTSRNIPPKVLEENLSADFKKKLHKWRVKKQTSVSNLKDPQISPTKESESKKIDWNLWKTGQLKLEGQGLRSLPDQKALPEDFQKKLEQWKKMKESNMVPPYNSQDSLKRQGGKSGNSSKFDGLKKSKDDDRSDREKQRPERDKIKLHEKDKSEKLSKLKAIVADPRVKEIEVQTSAGVMKFEGISRKFTRKLYEWEKARGIGPESSTFALLHPGYRPLDVGNATQDVKSHENSPTLGRSLSLDSISPHPSVPSISHQPSSLSLNDMDELKDTSDTSERRLSSDLGKEHLDEPEAVIVEVEDDIVETAAPLVAAIPMIEQQTPVYKYEVPCEEMCNSGENKPFFHGGHKYNHLSPKTLANVNSLKSYIQDNKTDYYTNIRQVYSVLSSLKDSLPELERNTKDGSQNVRETFEITKRCVNDIMVLLDTISGEGACSKEIISEKSNAIGKKLRNLEANINVIFKHIDSIKYSERIPEINVISDDGVDKSIAIISTTPTVFHSQIVINQPKILIGTAPSSSSGNVESPEVQDVDGQSETCSKKLSRNVSNGSKKKTRLRKMGSRQNSKTESDSSDEDTTNVVLEAPRRMKRKTSRAKKVSEDEKKIEEKKEDIFPGDDVVYVLKIKPGKVIEQHEISGEPSVLISPTETCIQLIEEPTENISNSSHVFVKTKRKIFTTVEDPIGDTKAVIVRDLESSSASDKNEKEIQTIKNLPPIPQSPNLQKRVNQKVTPPKEPSPSIRMMIAKYNQKVTSERKSNSPMSSGSCSPVMRSPNLDHRVKAKRLKYQESVERVVKSASAGNIRHSSELVAVEIDNKSIGEDAKILKSSSVETIPCHWRSGPKSKESPEYDCKPPLACDSLKLLSKQNKLILKEISHDDSVPKKEHIYRKNKEKPTSLFTKGSGNTAKKIGTKCARSEFEWRRSLSSSATEVGFSTPDKSDNTVPKITRKLDTSKPSSPKQRSASTEPRMTSASAPTTPLEDGGRPKTPLSERAIKLQKAKEDFLRGHIHRVPSLKEENTDVWTKRLSQVSVGSESSNDDCILSKSASVGIIESGSVDNEHIGGYVSLPRTISKSSKLSNKFGFSTLASKFRKVRMRRGSKEQQKINAVSQLCRQSLSIEVSPEDAASAQSDKISSSSTTSLNKSGSSLGLGTFFKKNDKNKLNKSKSSIIVGNEPTQK